MSIVERSVLNGFIKINISTEGKRNKNIKFRVIARRLKEGNRKIEARKVRFRIKIQEEE